MAGGGDRLLAFLCLLVRVNQQICGRHNENRQDNRNGQAADDRQGQRA